MECCTAIRTDETIKFAARWMDLEAIMLSEVRKDRASTK